MKWERSIPFTPGQSAETLAMIPETPAVFLLSGEDPNAEPYLNKAANLRRRLERLLSPASPDSKRLNLSDSTRTIQYTLTGSDFENRLLLYQALREYFPRS
jgi:excinuclease ABC subunit C